MRRRSMTLAAAAAALLTLAAAPASAESGRWNFHFSGFGPLPAGGDVGADWQIARPFALELRVGGGVITDFGQTVNGIFFSSVGARFRFFDDESGYLDQGGSVAGNLWVAPHVGFFLTEVAPGFLFDVSLGYDFSIVDPVSIGPFIRGGFGIAEAIAPFVAGGIQVSIEVDPLREPDRDTDGDGVLDRADRCPGTAPGLTVDGVGCSDVDRDGVIDPQDRCPDTPPGETVNGFGCHDSDRDGVYDDADECPDTPEGSEVDARGCIVLPPELVLDGIVFEYNSAAIDPQSERVLRGAAQALRDNPDVRVEVGGHTDNVGSRTFNQELSLARATSVRDWLIAHGIDAARLEVQGYGASQPRASNDDEAGRALNRRIEFHQLGDHR